MQIKAPAKKHKGRNYIGKIKVLTIMFKLPESNPSKQSRLATGINEK